MACRGVRPRERPRADWRARPVRAVSRLFRHGLQSTTGPHCPPLQYRQWYLGQPPPGPWGTPHHVARAPSVQAVPTCFSGSYRPDGGAVPCVHATVMSNAPNASIIIAGRNNFIAFLQFRSSQQETPCALSRSVVDFVALATIPVLVSESESTRHDGSTKLPCGHCGKEGEEPFECSDCTGRVGPDFVQNRPSSSGGEGGLAGNCENDRLSRAMGWSEIAGRL